VLFSNRRRSLVLAPALFLLTLLPQVLDAQGAAGKNIYLQRNLVSDIPGFADNTDPNLVIGWGISASATSPFWVSDYGTGVSTLYNGAGTPIALVVTVPQGAASKPPGHPTGQVFNSSTGFKLANGNPARFIFATIDGTISGWNGGTAATLEVDNSAAGAVYTGLGIGANASGPLLYAANFLTGNVDVVDQNWKLISVAGGFKDPSLPAGYAPFNVSNLGGKLYVTYGKQGPGGFAAGAGNGFVNVFDMDGNLVQRLVSNSALNLPWGTAIAPANWGAFGGALIVANFGDGAINAFDLKTGAFLGRLQDAKGNGISIPNIWGILFGNGATGGDRNTLYFATPTSNGDGKPHGLFGSIAPPAAIGNVNNGASNQLSASVSPGEIVTITGQTVGPTPLVAAKIPASGTLSTSLSDTSVYFNGMAAPVLYASSAQTSVIVPYGIAGQTVSSVVLTYKDQVTSSFTVNVAPSAPGVFTLDGSGQGAAVAFNQDGTLNAAKNPAGAGSVLAIYATGEGQTNPGGIDGLIAGVANTFGSITILRQPQLPVSVSIGGQPALVLYAGSSPGQPAGVMEVEVVVPSGAGTGAVPVVVTVGQNKSQANVTVNLK
jgi:uncharacterized protein (TIGR03118 family)